MNPNNCGGAAIFSNVKLCCRNNGILSRYQKFSKYMPATYLLAYICTPLDIAYCGRHIYECGWFAGGISAIFLP
jgi:hypothetical protein